MSANYNRIQSEINTLDSQMAEIQQEYEKNMQSIESEFKEKEHQISANYNTLVQKIKLKSNENSAKPKNVNNTLNQNALHKYGVKKFESFPLISLTKKGRLERKRSTLVSNEPTLDTLKNEITDDILNYFWIIQKFKRGLTPGDLIHKQQKLEKKYKEIHLKKYNTLEEFINAYAPKTLASRFTRKAANQQAQAFQAAALNAFTKTKKKWNNEKAVRNTLNQYEKETLLPYLEELKGIYDQLESKRSNYVKLQKNTLKSRTNANTKLKTAINTIQKTKKNKQNALEESLNPNDFKPIFEAAGFTYQPVTYKEVKKYRNSGSWYAAQGYYDNSYIEREEQPDYFYYELTRPYKEGDPIPEGWAKKEETYISGYDVSYHGYQGQYESKTPIYKTRTFLQRPYPPTLPKEYQGAVYRNKWLALKKYLQSANRT